MRIASVICLGLLTVPAAQAADQPVTLPIQRLTLDIATRMAQATIEACRKEGMNVAVTVIDRGGHPQVVLRDTLAMDLTLPISRMKAYTAMSFNSPTSQLEGRFKGSYSVPKIDSVIVAAGGLPINAGGAILGGIGVSGSPSGETDEKCAKAGVDAIQTELEMGAM
jgi:uncharacterized protein GlcG (DUF336 family)